MTLELLLLTLRILAGLLLLAFLGALFVMMWRDYRLVRLEVDSRLRPRGRLVVTRNVNNGALQPGMSFPLLPLTSLGRAPSNTIIVDDAFTSSEHALVTLRSGQWWLEDRGSSNGTTLNGYPVEEPVVISAGDVIGLGQVELKLELE